MELLNLLTQNLGVSEDQAKGGAGLIFKLAKDKLSDGDFSKVADAVPGMDTLLGAAPKEGGLGGAISGIASSFGGGGETLGTLASLASGFSKLDMDSGMVSKFMPIILQFVQAKGGDVVKGLLEKVLK